MHVKAIAYKALSIACNNLLIPTLMLLPFYIGKDDKISTHAAGMFMTCLCQWWLSQTWMKNYMRNEEILGSRLLEKSHSFVK